MEEERELAKMRDKLRHFYTCRDPITLKDETCFPISCNIHKERPYLVSNSREMYKLLIHKQLLLTQFELLCCSIELHNDPKWSRDKLNNIIQLIESFNNSTTTQQVTMTDICDCLVECTGFIAAVTIATNDDIEYVTKWIAMEWLIIVGVVLSVTTNSTLLNYSCPLLSSLYMSTDSWLINNVFLKENHGLSKYINILWLWVWQATGHRLMLMISGMGIGMKQKSMQLLHHLLKDITVFSPVRQCIVYVIDSINIKDQIHQIYSDVCKTNKLLSTNSVVTTISSYTLTTIKLSETNTNNRERDVTSIEPRGQSSLDPTDLVAKEINNLLLTYPLIHPLHCMIWCSHRRIIHELQQSLLSNNLSDIIKLVYEVVMKEREERGQLLKEYEAIVISSPLLCVSEETPKCLIPKRNMEEYTLLQNGVQQSEVIIDSLQEYFIVQWRNKCRLLFSSVFPPPKVWKKLEKQNEIPVPSGSYITLIKEQLILPLLTACVELSTPPIQRMCVFLNYSILLLEFWNTIDNCITRKRRLKVSRILINDYQYLQSLMADNNNSLYSDCREMVTNLPIYISIIKKLDNDDRQERIKECVIIQETILIIQTSADSFRKISNELQI